METVDDSTLGGYFAVHRRPPAFEGSDNLPYSAEIYISEVEGSAPYGAAILFVRWSNAGDAPTGHLETPYLAFGEDEDEAATKLGQLSLVDVQQELNKAIEAARDRPTW